MLVGLQVPDDLLTFLGSAPNLTHHDHADFCVVMMGQLLDTSHIVNQVLQVSKRVDQGEAARSLDSRPPTQYPLAGIWTLRDCC